MQLIGIRMLSEINVKGDDVYAQAFYDAIAKLPTTENDYVFVYYDNHSGPCILGTPTTEDIEADKLSEAFYTADKSKLYKQFLFLIEACYSGSVVEVFTASNLVTITTADPHQLSYAAVYDEELGEYLSNEFTNYFISYIDENSTRTAGELFTYLKKSTQESHVLYYGDDSTKSVPLSTFIGIPNKVLFKQDNANAKLNAVTPSEATQKTLSFLCKHSKLRLKAETEKLNAVLDMLIKYVDPKNYEKIMNDKQSKITPNYYQILKVFSQGYGKINPDDYVRLEVLVSLAATHSKAEIVQGIYAIL